MQPRRRAPAARWFALAALVLVAAGCTPQSVTEEGRAVYGLYNVFMYIAAVVFVVVSGLVIWSVIRYRRRDDELPKQTHGNNRLELTWTLIPTVIVLVLFVLTMQAQNKVLDQSGDADVNITVTAFQWSWRFAYEGTGAEVVGSPESIPEMVVPVGQTIRVKLLSADVVHSFYVPRPCSSARPSRAPRTSSTSPSRRPGCSTASAPSSAASSTRTWCSGSGWSPRASTRAGWPRRPAAARPGNREPKERQATPWRPPSFPSRRSPRPTPRSRAASSTT